MSKTIFYVIIIIFYALTMFMIYPLDTLCFDSLEAVQRFARWFCLINGAAISATILLAMFLSQFVNDEKIKNLTKESKNAS